MLKIIKGEVMKKILSGLVIVLGLIAISAFFSGCGQNSIVVDNFEDGNITENPTWWQFDKASLDVSVGPKNDNGGQYSLSVAGTPQGWYVGGCGVAIVKPVEKYTDIKLDIFGTGPESGLLKIELAEDDNGNNEIEQNRFDGYKLLKDDKFLAEVKVDWDGWKTVSIPFSTFKDDNPGVGNDQWDPDGKNNSGGLININFIAIGATETANVSFRLDNIEIVKVVSK